MKTYEDLLEEISRLKNSEKKYRTIVENANECICVAKNEFLTFVNTKMSDLFGYSKEELLSKPFITFIHNDDKEFVLKKHKSRLNEIFEPAIYDFRVIKKDQTIIWVQISSNIITFDNEISTLNYLTDITDRKREEENLKLMSKKLIESEEKFSKIFDSSPDMIILTKLSNGEIIDVNERFITHTKYTKEDVVGKNTLGINLWANLSDRDDYIKLLNENKFVRNREYDFKLKSGEVRNGLVSANILTINNDKCILGTVRDITEEKIIQNKLNDERIRLKTIFQATPDFIFIKDVNGNYLACNKRIEELFGAKEKDIIGKTDFDFLPKEVAEEFIINDKKAIEENKSITSIEHLIYPDSHKEIGQATKTPIYDHKNNLIGILGVAHNITEIYKIQEELHDREEIYSSIVNQANDSIALVDMETSKFFQFNEIAYKSLGYTKEEFKELTVKDIDAVSNTEEIFNSFEFFKENKNAIFETKHRSKNGEIRDVRISTKYLQIKGKDYLSTIWSDITESKRLSKILEDKNNFLELVINTIPNQLFWKDENLIYQGCNKVFADILGLEDPKYIIGMTDFDLNRKNDYSQSYINDDLKVIEEGKEILNIEEKYFNNKGEEGVVLTSKVPIKSSDNKVLGILGICIDITENKKREEEIEKLNKSLEERVNERTMLLEEANKELESFAYSVSHDLRAPIRHIDAFSKILRNTIKNSINEDSEKYFNKINAASNKMSRMIDDLLKFSRLGRKVLEKTDVDLNILIKEIIDQYKIDIGNRNIEFKIDNLPTIKGDKGLLQIVFENLISNSIKFTSKKDIAIIKIGQITKEDKSIDIYIKDNGVGFDMSYVDKLFGVFQRLHTEQEFAGTGIGLANIKQIIQKHGWTIRAEGSLNKGAAFYISLLR